MITAGCALVLAVIALYQVSLLGSLDGGWAGGEPPFIQPIEVGSEIDDMLLFASDGAGASSLADVPEGPCHVLVVFSAACPFSAQMAQRIGHLTENNGIGITWISVPDELVPVQQFGEQHGLEGRWLMIPNWDGVAALGAVATPSLIMLSKDLRYLGRAYTLDMEDWRCE